MDVVINTYDMWFKINATNINTMLQKAINTTWETHAIIILIRLKLNFKNNLFEILLRIPQTRNKEERQKIYFMLTNYESIKCILCSVTQPLLLDKTIHVIPS